ncbi:MAG: cytochrome C [Chloroflexi bacterium]|nr:MAG: cytochrome C [Chloroflexota bacterium]
MKRALKWIGIIVGGMVGLLVIVVVVLGIVGGNRLDNAPDVPVAVVAAATDEAAVERGNYLARVSSCTECHGEDLSGEVFIDEAPIGYVPAPNLTAGAGGIGANYTDADWAQAIRHGVGGNGRSLVTMPSNHYAHYGDDDFAALIAYLKTVPPVDNDLGERNIQFPGTIIFGVLAYNGVAAVANTDHAAVGGNAPAVSASAEYGEYLVNIASCNSCHGENLAGATDPDGPQGSNLTMGGDLQNWSEDNFFTALRTGVTPDGNQLDSEMPWQNYAGMSDTELEALWAQLNSVDALPTNGG